MGTECTTARRSRELLPNGRAGAVFAGSAGSPGHDSCVHMASASDNHARLAFNGNSWDNYPVSTGGTDGKDVYQTGSAIIINDGYSFTATAACPSGKIP